MAKYERQEQECEDYSTRQARLKKEKMISSRDTPLVRISSEQQYEDQAPTGGKDLGTLNVSFDGEVITPDNLER